MYQLLTAKPKWIRNFNLIIWSRSQISLFPNVKKTIVDNLNILLSIAEGKIINNMVIKDYVSILTAKRKWITTL